MKYFKLEEFFKSNIAKSCGIENVPPTEMYPVVKENLVNLVNNVLDPLRERCGFPVGIASGYRCNELNKAVGGSCRSDHLYGRAADIYPCGSLTTRIYMERVTKMYEVLTDNFGFDQVIFYRNRSFIHVSWRGERLNRKQIIVKR